MNREKQDVLFETWKEIAQFLDVEVRTCQRWEKDFGLPVYRQVGAIKSRVYAKKDELITFQEEFLKRNNDKITQPPEKEPENRTGNKRLIGDYKKGLIYSAMGTGTILLFFVCAFVGYWFFKFLGPPADFKIVDNTLFILDADKNELWPYKSGNHLLRSESQYRKRFIKGNLQMLEFDLPWLKIVDLDGDGKEEVLYCVVNESKTDSEFVVFNSDGSKRFIYNDWKAVTSGDEEFSPDFKIFGVESCDFDNDGKMEILLISLQTDHYPCQVTVFNHKGRLLGEYWHSGFLTSCRFADINNDGIKEVILGGTNNEVKAACLVVFNPFNLNGCSPQQTENYRLRGFPRGTELYYIRFPRTDVDKVLNTVETVDRLKILKNNRIQVRMQNSLLFYELDFQLKCLPIRSTNSFIQQHNQKVREGVISSTLDEQYLNRIRENILYYDGVTWSTTPTPVIYHK
jgi:hypothetical protein